MAGLLALILGCGEAARIEEYTVPKSPPSQRGLVPAATQSAPGPMVRPSFDVPPEWTPGPPVQFSTASFQVTDAGQEAIITVSPLKLLTAELILSSLNRWRVQVGLPKLNPGDPLDPIKSITAGDLEGSYLKLQGDDADPAAKAMLVAWYDDAGRTWYFKCFGDKNLVNKEEARFKTFVQSVRFSPKEEAGDE
jgi:hypothetical protein